MKNPELAKAAKVFRSVWQDKVDELQANEKRFMKRVNDILFSMGRVDDDCPMTSSYDCADVLRDVAELVELYNKLHHVVDVTSHWDDPDY